MIAELEESIDDQVTLIKELNEVWPPTVFFAVGFNLIVLTTDLILADYLRTFASFLVTTMTARQ